MTATVNSGATGKIAFYDGVNMLGVGAIFNSQATVTTVLLPSGTRSLRAYYSGDASFAATSSSSVSQAIVPGTSTGLRPAVNHPVSAQSSAMAVGDFNGDGKPDFATINLLTPNVQIFLGNGNGSFQLGQTYTTVYAERAIAVGDFNGDGRADLVVVGQGPSLGGLTVLLGNGDGTFQTPLSSSLPDVPYSVAVADFNGDGIADLVAVDTAVYQVSVLLGNGDGTFLPEITHQVAVGSGPRSVAIGDFNRDGWTDLAIASNSSIFILLGLNSGSFIDGGTYSAGPGQVVVADFNSDGKADFAVLNNFGVVTALGNGDGTFGPAVHSFPNSYFSGGVVADVDGDGVLDLITLDVPNSSVAVLRGNNDGTFQSPTEQPVPTASSALAAGDFNGDGTADIVVVGYTGAGINTLLGGAASQLSIAAEHRSVLTQGQNGAPLTVTVSTGPDLGSLGTVTVLAAFPPGLTAASLAGAGWTCVLGTLTCTRADSLGLNASYPPITILVNVAGGLTGNVSSTFAVSGGGAPNGASAIDTSYVHATSTVTISAAPNPAAFGHAVTLTATVTSGATGRVVFYDGITAVGSASLAGGTAVFTTALLPGGKTTLHAEYLGDSSYGPSASAAITETVTEAPGNIQPPVTYSAAAGSFGLFVADFNGDGNADLVTVNSNSTSGSVTVLLGAGDGTFGAGSTYAAGSAPANRAVTGDFNGDGHPDVLVATNAGLYLLAGSANGILQAAQLVSPANTYTDLVSADLDGDGKLDLVVVTSAIGGIIIPFLGNGDGTFQQLAAVGPVAASYVPLSIPLAIADVNGDGKPDLVAMTLVASAGPTVWLGNGDGTFQTGIPGPATNLSASAFAIADFNGDGNPDIAVLWPLGMAFLSGNGNGTFRSPTQSQQPLPVGAFVLAGDFDGDGKVDLVYGFSTSSFLGLSLGNGDGTFRPPVSLSTTGTPSSVVQADFNGDGVSDLAVASAISGKVSVLLGKSPSGLAVTSSHVGYFAIGQVNATYTLTVANTSAPSSGTVTVTDTLPAGLTATAIGGSGWNCSLTVLTCQRSDVLAANASYPAITLVVNVTGHTTGLVSNQVSLAGGGSPTVTSSDTTVIALGLPISIQTSPTGLTFSVDGGPNQVAPVTLILATGDHTIAVASPTPGSPGTQYRFTGWNDSGSASHTITVGSSAATYTASFQTQYLLTTTAIPSVGGSVTPASGYYDAGTVVNVAESPTSPYTFNGWSGNATGMANPIVATLSAPQSFLANFAVPGFTCDLNSDGSTNIADVQLLINQALGLTTAVNDLNRDGVVNVADVQTEINSALGLGCVY